MIKSDSNHPTDPSPRLSAAVLVYILIFLSPFSMYSIEMGRNGLTPIDVYSFTLFPFFLVICFLRNRFPNITGLGALHLLYVFIAAMSAIFALDKYGAFRTPIIYVLKYLFCFIYPIYFLRTRKQIETAIKIFIFVGILDALMGWTQLSLFFFFHKIVYAPFVELIRSDLTPKNFGHGFGALGIPGFVRMFGFHHEGDNAFGPYLTIPFALVIYAGMQYKALIYKFLAFFLGLTILISGSRIGLFTAGAACVFLFLFIRQRSFPYYPFAMRSFALIGSSCVVLLLAYLFFTTDIFGLPSSIRVGDNLVISTPAMLVKRMNPFESKYMGGTLWYFTSHLALAIKHGFDNFGFGLGGTNFDPFVTRMYPVKFGSHSNFIGFLGETGYWGFFAQIAIALTTIWYGVITYFNPADRKKKDHLVIFLTAIFVGLVVGGIIRTFYQDTSTFIVAGLIVKLYLMNKKQNSPRIA